VATAPSFDAPYIQADSEIARALLSEPEFMPQQQDHIDQEASLLIGAIRDRRRRVGGLEDVLHEYSLSTKEGLALMTLADALPRIPDAETSDRFIEDRLGSGNFASHGSSSDSVLVNASSWALAIAAKIVRPGETLDGTLAKMTKELGSARSAVGARRRVGPTGPPDFQESHGA
jgi:RHH-type proline utilization regulon transcriptional repressor/proline dehydrogenase/delta 1-pyrroline-5-carboxylate dehydrogenase